MATKQKHPTTHRLTVVQKPKNPATTQKIYALLSETTMLDDEVREAWLTRYDKLDNHTQNELLRELTHLETELRREEEAHLHRLAEVTSKYESRLKSLAREHRLLDLTPSAPAQQQSTTGDILDELLDDDFIRQLNELDNS